MSEKEFNEVFAKNLNYFLELNNKSQQDLANYIGVSAATVSNWCKGIKLPRMNKVDMMCTYFKLKRSDLMEDRTDKQEDNYYINEETREIAQEIYDNPDLKSLFDMSRNMSPERLKAHLQFMQNLHDAENNY